MSIVRDTRICAVLLVAALAACSSDTTSPNQPAVSDAQVESDVASSTGGQISSDAADYANADQGDYSSAASTAAPKLSASSFSVHAMSGCPSINSTFQLI